MTIEPYSGCPLRPIKIERQARQIVMSYGFDGVRKACASALESARVEGEGTDVHADSITRALIKCEFLTRIANLLISAGA